MTNLVCQGNYLFKQLYDTIYSKELESTLDPHSCGCIVEVDDRLTSAYDEYLYCYKCPDQINCKRLEVKTYRKLMYLKSLKTIIGEDKES